jgi:RNA polymerase-binding transcription factor DksA
MTSFTSVRSAHLTKTQLTTIPRAEASLRAERKKLLARLDQLELRRPETHQAEAESSEGAYFSHAALHHRLHQINVALERIRLGTYGRCTDCGAQLTRQRLAADYALSQCPACQRAQAG